MLSPRRARVRRRSTRLSPTTRVSMAGLPSRGPGRASTPTPRSLGRAQFSATYPWCLARRSCASCRPRRGTRNRSRRRGRRRQRRRSLGSRGRSNVCSQRKILPNRQNPHGARRRRPLQRRRSRRRRSRLKNRLGGRRTLRLPRRPPECPSAQATKACTPPPGRRAASASSWRINARRRGPRCRARRGRATVGGPSNDLCWLLIPSTVRQTTRPNAAAPRSGLDTSAASPRRRSLCGRRLWRRRLGQLRI
mmetsp:Transcript_1812/g.6456  ORF Transcript_1812/g.6456 Transcript_1812/m.6456 type:complete len:250 (+) Transcript_1812:3-752(+)